MRQIPRKLIRLSPTEWYDLLGAQLALARARATVRFRKPGDLVSKAHTREIELNDQISPRLRALERAVDRAARYGPFRASCLVRAIALARLMESRGFKGGRVRLGVALRGRAMVAHAWVDYGGFVVGDREGDIRQFAELNDGEVSL